MIQDEFVGLQLPVTLAFCVMLLVLAVIARVMSRLYPANTGAASEVHGVLKDDAPGTRQP